MPKSTLPFFFARAFGIVVALVLVAGAVDACATTSTNYSARAIYAGTYATAADMNADGKADLIVADISPSDKYQQGVLVYLSTTASDAAFASFAPTPAFVPVAMGDRVAVADIDGDGKPDLIVGSFLRNTLSVALNTTAPGAALATFSAPQLIAEAGGNIVVADLNGDGKPDVVVTSDDSVFVLLNRTQAGTVAFTGATFGPGGITYGNDYLATFAAVADVNGDGKPDVVMLNQNYTSASTLYVLVNTMTANSTAPSFAELQQIATGSSELDGLVVADVNSDGRTDLMIARYQKAPWVFFNTLIPGSAMPTFLDPQEFGGNIVPIAAVELNGDGKPDLLTAPLAILYNATTPGAMQAVFTAGPAVPALDSGSSVAVADVNGDGRLDIVTSSDLRTITVLLDSTNTPGINPDQHGITGSWFNPATGGQGLEVEVYPDMLGIGHGFFFGGWFTFGPPPFIYNPPGAVGQRWYALEAAVSSANPTSEIGIYTSAYPGNFAAPPSIPATRVGTANLRFTDCTHGWLSYYLYDYYLNDAEPPTGLIPLTRLTANTTCTASGDSGAAPSSYLLSGSWYDADVSGQGLVFDVNPAQNVFFAAWYTYATSAQQMPYVIAQRWYVIQAAFAPGATRADGPIYTDIGGMLDDPNPPTPQHVGEATIRFTSCAQATLQYTFFSGEVGTLHLTRTGPVPAGCSL
jgi:hypothetical protein